MILVKFKENHEPEEVIYGSEEDIIRKINKLNLIPEKDNIYRSKNKEKSHEYYIAYENRDDLENHCKEYTKDDF